MKKIKLKITLRKIFTYLYLLVVISVIASLFFISNFLYNNFYLIITQAQEIISLESQVTGETVDMKKYDAVMKKIEEKTKMPEVGSINNPFD